MKKIIATIVAASLMLVLLAGCGDSGSPGGGMPVVRIGVFQPASGANGAGGRQETLGTQFAHHQQPTVTIGGVEHQVELVIVDNQSSTAHSPTAAQSLVASDVALVLGTYGSAAAMAASDIFRDAGLTAIGVSCTNPGVTRDNDHYFRICFLDPFQGQILASLARANFNAEIAYVLALQGDDYSVGLSNYFMEAFEAKGGKFIYETFPEGTSDFSTYIASAKASGAGVFFSPTSTEAAGLIIDQAATQDLGRPILAGDTWDSNVVTGAAHSRNVQIFITTFYQEGGAPQFDSGIKEWISADSTNLQNNGGNDRVAAVTAMGYDAYFVALDILQRAGSITDQAAIRAATVATSFSGPAAGLIEFDEIGDAVRNTAFVKVINTETGEWDFYAQQGL
jgi:branched-chain amino acid transport system substrate-binding protein